MDTKISYKLKRSKRARRMRLAVYCDGAVVITSPLGVDQSIIEKFFSDKKRWVLDKVKFFKNIDSKAIRTFSHRDYIENKEKAYRLVQERAEFYNKIYGFSFNKIFIKNQKTRWGSCSHKGNLNLNYKIIFLSQKHQDYIIVHELCHLKEFNHSRKFWALVEKVLPNYLDIKKELRNYELLYK
ncbi:MAG TPA: M48 family metallopeptidase [Candidatus Paceibacterota bacterium]|nr:M48 family metallopeptidase [Candidatus Paceibacterota bacterium]